MGREQRQTEVNITLLTHVNLLANSSTIKFRAKSYNNEYSFSPIILSETKATDIQRFML